MHGAAMQIRGRRFWAGVPWWLLAAVMVLFVVGPEQPSVADRSQPEGPSSPTKQLDQKQVERIIARMIAEGRRYDPTELLEHGEFGVRSLFRGVFPKAFATTRLSREDARELILELGACTRALAKSREDSVHNILLPLLEHQDPAVPIFAMQHIAGRTGNSYVAPIHLHALESGRPQLMKTALRSMPCPIWDGRAKPKVRKVLRDLFTGAEEGRELRADTDVMMLCAFVAARDFRIPEARDYLQEMTKSDDQKIALRAIQNLGDTYYKGTPLYFELLTALRPHLTSDDPRFRQAAVKTLGYYRGSEVIDRLITTLGDPEAKVFQEAAEALMAQEKSSPVVDKLRREKERTNDKTTRERIESLLEKLDDFATGLNKH